MSKVESVKPRASGRSTVPEQVADVAITGERREATGLGKSRSMERQAYCRGSIANFFIRERSVVRLMPMRAAAPSTPPTRPLDSVSA